MRGFLKMYKTVDLRKMAAFLEGEFTVEGAQGDTVRLQCFLVVDGGADPILCFHFFALHARPPPMHRRSKMKC